MTYLIALLCPPLALVLLGRPLRAILATILLVLAALTWTSGLGLVLAAMTTLWALRAVGEIRAKRELDGFLEVFHEAAIPHR